MSADVSSARGAFTLLGGAVALLFYILNGISSRRAVKALEKAATQGNVPDADFVLDENALILKKKATAPSYIGQITWLLVAGAGVLAGAFQPVVGGVWIAGALGMFYLKRLAYKSAVAIGPVNETASTHVQVKSDGLHFSSLFVEPSSYGKLLEQNTNAFVIPWGDIRAIHNVSVWGLLNSTPMHGRQADAAMQNQKLRIIFTASSASAKLWSKELALSLYLVNQRAELTYWLKHYAGKKCKL